MAKKHVCISFDYQHDRDYRYLLNAFTQNPKSPIEFEDLTPDEIRTSDIGRVKAVLRAKIRRSTHVLVLVGKYATTRHKDSQEIGSLNWQWWEIKTAKEEGKKLIAVKIEKSNSTPDPLLNAGATWALSFNVPAIEQAVNDA